MEIEESLTEKIKYFAENPPKTLITSLGIEFTTISKARVCGKMPVDDRTKQPFGILHGGASVALAETLASIGAWANLPSETEHAVGLEINANHIRSTTQGWVFGEATPIHLGRKTQVWEIKITDEQKRLVCVSRCTMAVIKEEA